MPKVSVIIPVYKTEDYLRKCLDSVCNQTLKDIEIICINDCSPDGCLEILKEYASKDERIKIIDFKENKGAACARNAGIDAAQGEYLGFVDSDDFIDLDFYEKLYFKGQKNRAEIAKANIIDITINNIATKSETSSKVKLNKIYFTSLYTSAIYLKEFILKHNIYFIEGLSWGEDRLFPVKAAYYAKNIKFVNGSHYYYARRPDSTTCTTITYDNLESAVTSAEAIVAFLNNSSYSQSDYVYLFKVFFDDIIKVYLKFNKSDFNVKSFKINHLAELFKYHNDSLYFYLNRILKSIENNTFNKIEWKKISSIYYKKDLFNKLRKYHKNSISGVVNEQLIKQ